jgi:hypothetical protein
MEKVKHMSALLLIGKTITPTAHRNGPAREKSEEQTRCLEDLQTFEMAVDEAVEGLEQMRRLWVASKKVASLPKTRSHRKRDCASGVHHTNARESFKRLRLRSRLFLTNCLVASLTTWMKQWFDPCSGKSTPDASRKRQRLVL